MNADEASFVDTNVLVYAFDRSNPRRSSVASKLLAHLLDENLLRLSTQVLKEFFVTVTRKIKRPLTPSEAIILLDDFSEWPVISLDVPMIRESALLADRSKISFWDALILVAAQRSGCRIVYSEDLNHGQEIGGVQVLNPFADLPTQSEL